ncbi:hypothetical protein [Streptosporangium sp. NPDC000396]|uniref:hypothetical protein n=1 Tax=Streptosporangium sp. NPDC000396 TaxID=3366185 RepID=UPI0036CB0C82
MNQVGESLKRALRSGKPVRVGRGINHVDRLDAYVVGIGRKWVMLHTISDAIRLDGYSAVRLRDVAHATRSGWKGADVAHRALILRGEHAQALAAIDLDTTAGLIDTMTKAFPLVGIYIEEIDPDVCYIGRPRGITRKKNLRLQEISPRATWGNTCFKNRTADITRLDAGSGYLNALHAVGGDPPEL